MNATTPAFGYLVLNTTKNRLLSRLRRAKNPRYALAMIIGAGYLWMVYLRPQMHSRPKTPAAEMAGPALWTILGTAVILVMAGLAWFVENGASALALDEAESYFILPAPVSRRGLVGYKVMRAQLAVLTTVVVWSVLMRRTNQSLEWPMRAVGVWIFFTTTNLHRTGAELVRAAWSVGGTRAMRRHWAATLGIIVVILGLATSLGLNIDALRAATHAGFNETLVAIARTVDSGPAGIVLWPIHAILGPMVASSSTTWMLALPGAIAVLVAHGIWIATADDVAIEAAVIRASDRMALVRGKRANAAKGITSVRPKPDVQLKSLALKSTGWPGMAIIWKNILCMRRKARPTTLGALMLLPVGLGAILSVSGPGPAVGIAVAGFGAAAILLLFGPLMVRSDLRADMVNIVAIKLMPLRGHTVVAAEVLSIVVPLGLVQAVVITIAAFATLLTGHAPFTASDTLIALVGVLPSMLVFSAAFVTIQNAAPVLFPAWAKLGVVTGGMEAIGQMVILLAIFGGLLLFMLILPATVATAIIFFGRSHPGPSIAAGLLLGGAILAFEVGSVMMFLGRALERTEPSDVATS
jgi:hypothetical protein